MYKSYLLINRIKLLAILLAALFMLSGCSIENESGQESINGYVINTRTGKIHSSDCWYVSQMSDKNKLIVTDSLTNLLQQRYTICRKWRAGIEKSVADTAVDYIFFPNLYGDVIEIDSTYDDYIKAIDQMSEWYVSHVPNLEDKILRANEEAVVNYKNEYVNIDFEKKIAYYPCELLSGSEYTKPGDDCVRYVFAV